MPSIFDLLALLLTATAGFAWVNHVYIGLPHTIGLMLMGLVSSLLLIAAELLVPDVALSDELASIIRHIDFQRIVLDGMLAFLLFAGALHVDFSRLRRRAWSVGTMATMGVVVSTALVGTGLWLLAPLLGVTIPFVWALVFGALIAPTDPIAVLTTLKSVDVPSQLETDISGEALFNDGFAIVMFTLALQLASRTGEELGLAKAGALVLLEAGGGACLGYFTGLIAYRALRAIDDYAIEVLISLALVTGTYAFADAMQMSGPIAVVVAGVLIGNRGAQCAMSKTTRRYVFGFWRLIDDTLNAVLFLLIGLEMLVVQFEPSLAWIGLAAIPLALAGRFASVGIPVALLRRWRAFAPGTVSVLTWGGVHGGISVALALSLPDSPARSLILTATYCVVLFSVIIQGLTLEGVVRRSTRASEEGSSASLSP